MARLGDIRMIAVEKGELAQRYQGPMRKEITDAATKIKRRWPRKVDKSSQ
jgi:hypothetical protein